MSETLNLSESHNGFGSASNGSLLPSLNPSNLSISGVVPGLTDPLQQGSHFTSSSSLSTLDTGVFTVGATGQVSFDYLFDGGAYEGEVAVFSLTGMDRWLQSAPNFFAREAALRALSNSDLGHIVISDQTEGARFSGSLPYDGNFNAGSYLGTKSFSMRPGEQFGIMLVPNGTVKDVLLQGGELGSDRTPLFSISSLNLNNVNQFAQIVSNIPADGNAFAFEDLSLNGWSDRDFNDIVFQMKGAAGNAPLLDSVVASGKNWRTSGVGQQVEQFTVDPLDLAGNTIDAARRVNVSTAGRDYQGWVGNIDKDDFYSFSLGAKNDFKLLLEGLNSNANVELLDINGKVIKSSENSGTTSELISTTLNGGAYRIRVTSAENIGTPFNLKLFTTPQLEGITTTGSEAAVYLSTNASSRLIRMNNFRSASPLQGSRPEFAGIDGRGYRIAILDTGIDEDHPFFGPDTVNDNINRADRIVFQQDFAYDDMTADDNHGHGTHVSSIATSQDPTFTGMAPGAGIIHLKVLNDTGGTVETPNGVWADVEQALQWVVEHADTDNIASVNMSFGDHVRHQTDESRFGIGDELATLAKQNVIVVASSGNFFNGPGVEYPSSDRHALSVGSVLDGGIGATTADQIALNSQRDANLTNIFAPGRVITAARTGGGTIDMSGTSMAAPHVAGMAALAQQLAQQELGRQLTPEEFRRLLYNSGIPINDPAPPTGTGVTTFRRADMLGLANAIMDLRPPSDRNIDLSASRFDVVQTALNTGDSLTANFQIQNTGLDSAGSFNVNFYLSDDNFITQRDYFLGSFTIDRLSSNGNTGLLSQSLNLPSPSDPIWRSFGSGSGHVGMIVDGLNTVGETNENNNSNLGLAVDSDTIGLSQRGQLTATINRLVGDFDGFGAGASDYFTLVSFSENPPNDENAWLRSPEQTGNDISPNWQLGQPVTGVTVPITIRVYDNDGFLAFDNDHVDIDPDGGDKDLNLTYNLFTGEVSGDVGGIQGQQLYSRGGGDDDQGEIWFTVNFEPTA